MSGAITPNVTHATVGIVSTQRDDERMPVNMPTENRPINLGRSMNDQTSRLDGIAKVTGQAKYGRDVYPANCLFVGFVRCPFGAAKLIASDVEAARQSDGVVEVNLEGKEGRYHGHTVGYIVAESKTALRRAMKVLAARWELQSVKTGIEDAVGEPPAPPAPSSQTQEILAKADHVLEAVYATPVQTHSALETHGVVIEPQGERTIVYASTQGTFSVRDGIGEALQLPNSKYEVRCEYVGGGFGAKFGPGKEGMIAGQVAAKYKRPVSLFVDRDEEHLDTGNRPSSRTLVKIGFRNDGTILGGQIHTWGGTGVGRGGGGVNIPSKRYDLGAIQKEHEDVQFNGGAPRAMRAPGHPQGAFAEELMLDEIAAMANVDPLELRLKLDADEDRREMYRQGAQLIGWDKRQANGSQTGRIRRGFGMGSTSWGAFPAEAAAEVVISRDGSVEVRTGTQDIGTGQRTVMGVIAAERLGVPLDVVNVRIGSSALPEGPGSGGSVTAPNTSLAVVAAALDARQKLLKLIADREGADASEYEISDGNIIRNGQTVIAWRQACRGLPTDTVVGRGDNGGETRRQHWGEGHSHGAQFVDLEVDSETGVIRVKHVVALQACGKVIARKTAESQIIGGVIQGISFALFENKLLDRKTGAMVNPNLEMYKVLGSMDMPRIQPILWTRGQTGVRSLGEPPVVPTAGAVACAVLNAMGAAVRTLPVTPDKVLAALEQGKGGRS